MNLTLVNNSISSIITEEFETLSLELKDKEKILSKQISCLFKWNERYLISILNAYLWDSLKKLIFKTKI